MKIICTTENVIEKKESCKKTYCCARMKKALNQIKTGKGDYDYTNSNFTVGKNKITLLTHSSYHESSHYMNVDFCLFCGKKVVMEHVKVDKTSIPPKPKPKPPVLRATSPPPPLKKKHWWSR